MNESCEPGTGNSDGGNDKKRKKPERTESEKSISKSAPGPKAAKADTPTYTHEEGKKKLLLGQKEGPIKNAGNDNHNFHSGTFKTSKDWTEKDTKKALSDQGKHLVQSYADKNKPGMKSTEKPGDLTAAWALDKGGCSGTLCFSTSSKSTQKGSEPKQPKGQPAQHIEQQKDKAEAKGKKPVAAKEGHHGEVGSITGLREANGLGPNESFKNGGHNGGHIGSVNLKTKNPEKVVPQSACTGPHNCKELVKNAGLDDIFAKAPSVADAKKTIKDSPDKAAKPGEYHPSWVNKRALLRRAMLRRAILKRAVDNFVLDRRESLFNTEFDAPIYARYSIVDSGFASYGRMGSVGA
jgi:hypothetical protein